MSQLGKSVMTLGQDEPESLFDAQCILDSMSCGVAIFNQNLELVNWNSSFSQQLKINNDDLEAGYSLEDIFTLSASDAELTDENNKTIALMQEMYQETDAAGSFNWVYKYQIKKNKTIVSR